MIARCLVSVAFASHCFLSPAAVPLHTILTSPFPSRHNLDHHFPHHPKYPRHYRRGASAFRATGQKWARGKGRGSAAAARNRGTHGDIDGWNVVGSVDLNRGSGAGMEGLGLEWACKEHMMRSWWYDDRRNRRREE
jgi:hypothetical protein